MSATFDVVAYSMGDMAEASFGTKDVTFMAYLSDVEAGGATVFPLVGVSAWPKKRGCHYLAKPTEPQTSSTDEEWFVSRDLGLHVDFQECCLTHVMKLSYCKSILKPLSECRLQK